MSRCRGGWHIIDMHGELGRLGVLAGYLGFEIRELLRTYGVPFSTNNFLGVFLIT